MAVRTEMAAALKAVTIPRLRAAGFTGSFPHFRRVAESGADLISFQFDRHGGSFVVEIAKCHPNGIVTPARGLIAVSRATAQDRHPNNRRRILRGGSDWFDFEREQPEVLAEAVADELVNDAIWLTVSRDGSEAPYLD